MPRANLLKPRCDGGYKRAICPVSRSEQSKHGQLPSATDIYFSVCYSRNHELHRSARVIPAISSLIAIVEFNRHAAGLVRVQNRLSPGSESGSIHGPDNPVGGSVSRDHRCGTGERIAPGRLADRRSGKQTAAVRVEGECPQHIVLCPEIDGVVPVGRCAEVTSERARKFLHDLGITSTSCAIVPHLATIYKIDGSFLTSLYQQMLVGRPRGQVRQQQYPAGSQICIATVQAALVVRSEPVCQWEFAGSGRA